MRLAYAAAFSLLTVLIAALYSGFIMQLGLRANSVLLPRKEWILANAGLWALGWWLWLVVIFGWMLLLVVLMWRYTPAHRVATMLQSGLLIISALLAMCGSIVAMNVLPAALSQPDGAGDLVPSLVALVDAWSGSFLASGLTMGGIVTAWIGLDLMRLKKLPWSWLAPGVVAAALMIPSAFTYPNLLLLILAAIAWIGWCLFLATRREEPRPFPEIL